MSNQDKDKYGVEPLSNFEIIRILSNEIKERCNIVDTTRNLNHLNNIEDLFQKRGHFIMFLPSENKNERVGHWVVCVRQKEGGKKRKGSCIYFDSYGDELKNKHILNITFGF